METWSGGVRRKKKERKVVKSERAKGNSTLPSRCSKREGGREK